MGRALSLLGLTGLLAAAPAAAAPNRDAHRHPGLLFEIRYEPVMNTAFVYRAFLADPDRPETLLVERSDGWLGDVAQRDFATPSCPAATVLIARLGTLPIPTVALDRIRPYNPLAPQAASYHFDGFVHFPNGAEGEVSFYAYDQPGQRADPLLDWARGLVRAVDACARRGG